MIKIRKILYPTDFSDSSDAALAHALQLSGRYKAELHMLHAHVLHDADPADVAHRFPSLEELYVLLEGNADDQMSAAIEKHDIAGLKVERAQVRGVSAAASILDYAEEHDIDLVVMGTH